MTKQPTVTVDTEHGTVDVPAHVAEIWRQYGTPDSDTVRNMAEQRQEAIWAEERRVEQERRAADPRYRRDYQRTECSPDCEMVTPAGGGCSWLRHTRWLGLCTEAKPVQSDPETYVALNGFLDSLEDDRVPPEYSPSEFADQTLMWLRDHPEFIPRIWPDRAAILAALDQPTQEQP